MTHQIRVTLNNGDIVTINVVKSARLIRGIVENVQEIIQMLRKSICKKVDSYNWSKAEYIIDHNFVVGTIAAI